MTSNGVDNWAFFTAKTGDELTRGWQGTEEQARKLAQSKANRQALRTSTPAREPAPTADLSAVSTCAWAASASPAAP